MLNLYLRRSVIRHDLELSVEVEEEVDEAAIVSYPVHPGASINSRKRSSRVSRHPTLQRIIDLIHVAAY